MTSPDGISSDLEVEALLPVDNRWRESLRRRARRDGVSELAAALSPKPTKSSLEKWIGSSAISVPSLITLRSLEERLGYSLAEQLIDLGLVTPSEVSVGITALPSSTSLILGRLEISLNQLTANRHNVWDLARAVTDDCVDTGHHGRWRARVFDIPATGAFRYTSHRAVEFLRAQELDGNTLGSPKDTLETEGIVHVLAPDEGRWADLAPFGLLPDNSNYAHWLERIELSVRSRKVREFMSCNEYGGVGDVHKPLLNTPNRLDRHIYVDVAGATTAHDLQTMIPINSAHLSQPTSTTVKANKVLIIGPPAVSNMAITRMIAAGLGWPAQTTRERASMVGVGRLRTAVHAPQVDRLAQAMSQIAQWRPAHPTLISLSSVTAAIATPDELREFLLDESAIPILLQPTKPTLQRWEDRQLRSTPNPAPHGRTEPVFEAMRTIGRILKSRSTRHVLAKMPPSAAALPWDDDRYFMPPAVGDFTIRAAHQLAYLLVHGEQRPPGACRETRFMPGSVLAQYEDQLRSAQEGRKLPLRVSLPPLRLG